MHDADDTDNTKALLCQVTVTVHPIDAAIHPSYPTGWRWGVTVGGQPINDLDYCIGAGHEDTETRAAIQGEMVGAAATLALRHYGLMPKYAFQRLDWDPIPAEADNRPVLKFGGE